MLGDYSAELALVDAQVDELEKIALGAGAGRAIGGLLGAGIGGTAGYYTAPPDQRATKAIKGALVGGLAGVAGGQAATKAGRTQIGQFAQRQAHGLTGYMGKGTGWRGQKFKPQAGESMQEARVRALKGMGWKVPKKVETTGVGKITPTEGAVERAVAKKKTGPVSKLWRGGRADKLLTKQKLRSEAAQRMLAEEGLTSLPGLAKGYATGTKNLGRAGVLKANLLAPGAALGVGLPVAFAAPGVAEGVQKRDIRPAARSIVESAGYSLGGGLPMVAALGLGTGISTAAGKLIGGGPQASSMPRNRLQDAASNEPAGPVGALPGRVGALRRQVGHVAPGAVK